MDLALLRMCGRTWGMVAAVVLVACGDDGTDVVEPVPPAPTSPTVTVTPRDATLYLPRGTIQLVATARDGRGQALPAAAISWSSDLPAVATVDRTGLVTAVGEGVTSVSALYRDVDARGSIVVKSPPDGSDDPDRAALWVLYDSTGGADWSNKTNWQTDEPLSSWYGVSTDEDGRVHRLDLTRNGLVGVVPSEIGDLTFLQRLDLEGNRLTEISPGVGRLKYLELLLLNDNRLTGPIPPELGMASGLMHIQLHNNPLDGLLPHALTALRPYWFQYDGTQLCTPRSPAFSRWIGRITGAFISSCRPARHDRLVLAAVHDALGGSGWTRRNGWLTDSPIGEWAGVTVDADGRVTGLDLRDNEVEGELPRELGYLDALTRLDLSGNDALAGPFPSWMTDLALDSMRVNGTGLCVPPDPGFRDWLAGIEAWSGSGCEGPDSVRASLEAVYLTQASQDLAGGVPLIAGRDAFLRAFAVADLRNYLDSEVRVRLYRDGEVVHTASVALEGGIPTSIDESDLPGSHNALIPGAVLTPGLEMVAEFDPDSVLSLKPGSRRRLPETGTLALDVRELPAMDLTIVPVLLTDDPDLGTVARAVGLTPDSPELRLTRTLLPIGEFSLRIRDTLKVTRATWESNFLNVLEVLRGSDGATGHYLAIHAEGGIANVSARVATSGLNGSIIAHELGHNLSLLHAPCGNPADLDPGYPYPGGRTGIWGYELGEGEVRNPALPDLMSYCREPYWISDYNFSKALVFRLNDRANPSRAATVVKTPPLRTRTLILWGHVGTGGVALDPAVVMDASPSLPDARGGPYRIEGLGRDGATLFALNFAPSVEAESGEGHFAFMLPIETTWVDELSRITLSGPAGFDALNGATRPPLAIVTNRLTGRIRSILRGFATSPQLGPDEEISVSRGVPTPEALRGGTGR